MSYSLSKEQVTIRESIIKFALRELNSNLMENEEKGYFPRDKWKKCCEMGLIALLAPQEYGGCGEDLSTLLHALQALSYACKDTGLVHSIVTQIVCMKKIALYGTESQKQMYLPPISKGEKIAAQAVSEPEAGSDVLSMRTKAIKSKDTFILSGTKTFVSNAPLADVILVLAVTNPERRQFGGISCFIVEKDTNGCSSGKPFDKMGLRTLQLGELFFDECSIPTANLLGREGQGMIIFNELIEWERALLSAVHLGTMERVLESCLKYAKTRVQFGHSIGKFQSISNKIADMKINIELGKLILHKISWLKKHKKRATLESSIGKLFISEALKKACTEAVQIHGGYGYMKEYEVERDLRDSIASTIYSGTSELQRNIISTLAGL